MLYIHNTVFIYFTFSFTFFYITWLFLHWVYITSFTIKILIKKPTFIWEVVKSKSQLLLFQLNEEDQIGRKPMDKGLGFQGKGLKILNRLLHLPFQTTPSTALFQFSWAPCFRLTCETHFSLRAFTPDVFLLTHATPLVFTQLGPFVLF